MKLSVIPHLNVKNRVPTLVILALIVILALLFGVYFLYVAAKFVASFFGINIW